jgi:1-acyl-sn-glycerol-3-phosphate acyltransferase
MLISIIPNAENFEDILHGSKLSMEQGNCFIIFPEGTRTRPEKFFVFKKGTARIALNAGSDVIPIYFGGNSKTGLGKNDKFLSFNPSERYHYNLEVLESISTEKYRGLTSRKRRPSSPKKCARHSSPRRNATRGKKRTPSGATDAKRGIRKI